MTRRLSAPLAALAAAALLAGCGGGSSSSTATTSSAPASAARTGTAATGSGEAVSPADREAALQACKQAINAQTTLSGTVKAKLEGICQKAAAGDRAAVVKAAREVCEEVVKNSSVPASVAKELLTTCKEKVPGG